MSALPHWPESLPLDMAAAYCGLSPDRFRNLCPVPARRIGDGQRDRRWLRSELDAWLLTLPVDGAGGARNAGRPLDGADWMKRLRAGNADDDQDHPRQAV